MRNTIISLIFIIGLVLHLPGCVEDPDLSTDVKNATPPTVQLLTGTSSDYKLIKTATSVTIQAEVTSANGLPVDRYGVCWALSAAPTVEKDEIAVSGSGLGAYKATANNLRPDKVYYIRPFAQNEKGISYGEELSVTTTTGLGVVQTLESQQVKASSVLLGGKIIDRGEGDIQEMGVYVAVSEKDPSPRKIVIETLANDSTFTQTVTGLKPETKYYSWAYVTNSFGTVKGSVREFTTTSGKPLFSSIALTAKTYTSVTMRAILKSLGDGEVTDCGFCYSSTQTLPSLEDDATVTVKVACKITNDSIMNCVLDNLKQQTPYYVRAYVVNSYGTVYSGDGSSALSVLVRSQAPTVITSEIATAHISKGSIQVNGAILDKGETDITDAGFCWSSSNRPTLENSQSVSTYSQGDSLLTATISGLKGGNTYYIVAYAKNSKATSYGEVKAVKTPDVVTTLANYIGESVTEASFCMHNSSAYILGGDLGGQRSLQLVSFDTRTETWQTRVSAKESVKGAAFFSLNPFSILSLGGRNNADEVTKSFYYYAAERNTWTKLNVTDNTPSLYGAVGLSLDNCAYYWGGSSTDTMNMQIFKFEGSTESWSVLPYTFPQKQLNGVAVWINNKAYAGFGMTGNSLSGASYSKRLWMSDKLMEWEELPNCPTSAKGIVNGVASNGKLYVLDTDLNMWTFDPTLDSWSKQLTSFGTVLSGGDFNNVFMFATDNAIYIGLTNGSKKFVKYDPSWDN